MSALIRKANRLPLASFKKLCNSENQFRIEATASVFRKYSTTSTVRKENHDDLKLINSVEKTVKSFGYLELRNLDLDISVKPACPLKYPDMNRAICTFYSSTEQKSPNVVYSEDKLSLTTQTSYQPKENNCCFEIPIKYDVDCANILGENSVKVESLESGSIRVTTGSGPISSKSIKGDYISLLSQSGNVTCLGVSQGRIVIQSGTGEIHGHKFQGPSLKVATQSGNITADSVYSDSSQFVSATGNITLKNLHRKCNVKITSNGNLSISGMDGSLDAQLGQGRHQIQISMLQENSSVRIVHGSLKLKVPEDCPFGIRVSARSIVTPEKMPNGRLVSTDESSIFEYRSEEGADARPIIDIEAKNGQVAIEYQDWFASLQLGSNKFKSKE